uniref:Polymerase kappa isoform 10 n=1 Tax=Mus musculus TaxID=10090 RepID=Q5Q9G9_MOUSE|nr:polymerase kappa isoform 10 [Mus musculus]
MDNTKEKDNFKDDLLLRMGLNDNKAGMEGLDKEKINKIIMEATKGSRFYGNELKKEKQVNQRIENMMQQKAQITSQQLRKAQLQVDKFAMELERNRNLNNTIVHVDMDAFYAAVEMRDNPELKDKPIAVGSMSMLATSNYHARRFGVRAAMPGFIAKRLCPQLIIVPPNFDKYRAVSKEVKEILAEYDPNFMAMSLDEAYLNITQHLQERQDWPEDKRRYFIKMGNYLKIDTPRQEANELTEYERSISPLLFEDVHPSIPLCEKRGHENGEITLVDGVDLTGTEDRSLKAARMDTLENNRSKEECPDIPDKSCPISLENETISTLSRQDSVQPCTDEVVTGRALVCPVCNLEQETSDLTLFNIHVDICLNKGIIQELRNSEGNSVKQPKESSRSTDRLQKASGRTKRPGTKTKSSTLKKTKPRDPRHTLDGFFK